MWYNVKSGFVLHPKYLGGTGIEEKINEENVDYRKMYYHLAGAVETAIRLLIAAQQRCEDILLDDNASRHTE